MHSSASDRPRGKNILGVVLGTGGTVVGFCQGGHPEIVMNPFGSLTTPSVVLCRKDSFTVGKPALEAGKGRPDQLIYDVKRMLGLKYSDRQIRLRKKDWQFRHQESSNGDIELIVEGREEPILPIQVCGEILRYLVHFASSRLGSTPTEVVLAFPLWYTEEQQQSLRNGAQHANLRVLELIPEPIAAALGYDLDEKSRSDVNGSLIVVVDIGAASLEVTALKVQGLSFEILGSAEDLDLGGQNFTKRIADHFIRQFDEKSRLSEGSKKQRIHQKIYTVCEDLKIALSQHEEQEMEVHFGLDDPNLDIQEIVTRAEFERMTKALLDQCIESVKTVFQECSLTNAKEIQIILVGGATLMPQIRRRLGEEFPNAKVNQQGDPLTAVARGTCIAAGHIADQRQMKGKNEQLLTGITVIDRRRGLQHPAVEPLPFHVRGIHAFWKKKGQTADQCIEMRDRYTKVVNSSKRQFCSADVFRRFLGEQGVNYNEQRKFLQHYRTVSSFPSEFHLAAALSDMVTMKRICIIQQLTPKIVRELDDLEFEFTQEDSKKEGWIAQKSFKRKLQPFFSNRSPIHQTGADFDFLCECYTEDFGLASSLLGNRYQTRYSDFIEEVKNDLAIRVFGYIENFAWASFKAKRKLRNESKLCDQIGLFSDPDKDLMVNYLAPTKGKSQPSSGGYHRRKQVIQIVRSRVDSLTKQWRSISQALHQIDESNTLEQTIAPFVDGDGRMSEYEFLDVLKQYKVIESDILFLTKMFATDESSSTVNAQSFLQELQLAKTQHGNHS